MHKEKINIVIPCYDRPSKLKNLIVSISSQKEISFFYKLWFLVDFSDYKSSIFNCIENSDIKHEYEIIDRSKKYGLKKNVIDGISEIFKKSDSSFIVHLEDDLLLSKYAFQYIEEIINKDLILEEDIFGVSLYSPSKNPWNNIHLIHSSSKPLYLMQLPSSLGSMIKREYWHSFVSHLSPNYQYKPQVNKVQIPIHVLGWNRENSWKRELIEYMVQHNLYFLYPKVSYTAHLGNLGTNVRARSNTLFNSSLASTVIRSEFDDVNTKELEKYDVFCEVAPTTFLSVFDDAVISQLNVDLYGLKPVNDAFKYMITSKNVLNSLESFGFELECIHQNIEYKIEGKTFNLVRTRDVSTETSSFFDEIFEANYSGVNKRQLIAYLWRAMRKRVFR